jgi:hypothetical protein
MEMPWNDNGMKWQGNENNYEMTMEWNDNLMKWQWIEMTMEWNDNGMKWQCNKGVMRLWICQITSWWNVT